MDGSHGIDVDNVSALAAQWGQEYHSQEALTATLEQLRSSCGPIFRHFSIGQSVEGRDIWVARITDNPETREGEPEFLYVANIHGDEPLGRELLIRMAEDICVRYAVGDPLVQDLVNATDIYFLFNLNPDGFAAGTRENANKADLNRDFPNEVTGQPSVLQPETQATLSFLGQHRFSLGANFHEGTLCCNYPWDSRSDGELSVNVRSRAPDNHLFRRLCEAYSDAHPTMHSSWEFREGITNGAAYYTAYGSLQDYAYSLGMLHVTLELGYQKHPSPDSFLQAWQDNAPPLYAFLEHVHMGVRGRVTCSCDATQGPPSVPASASLTWRPLDDGHQVVGTAPLPQAIPVWTEAGIGDYHRLLLPGEYEVQVEGCGAEPTWQNLTIPHARRRESGLPEPLRADFQLVGRSCDPALVAAEVPPAARGLWALDFWAVLPAGAAASGWPAATTLAFGLLPAAAAVAAAVAVTVGWRRCSHRSRPAQGEGCHADGERTPLSPSHWPPESDV